jgi:hypothetical protein
MCLAPRFCGLAVDAATLLLLGLHSLGLERLAHTSTCAVQHNCPRETLQCCHVPGPGPSPPCPGPHGRAAMWRPTDLHTCIAQASGRLLCFGWGDYGQLGNRQGTTRAFAAPADQLQHRRMRWLAAGRMHTCGIAADGSGTVACWGMSTGGNSAGAAGADLQLAPRDVSMPPGSGAVSLCSGAWHSCMLLKCGREAGGKSSRGASENRQADNRAAGP